MLSKIKKNPDYNRTAKIARNFMIEQNLSELPIDPFNIANKNGWIIEKASEIANDINVTVYHLLNNMINSSDGAAIYCKEVDKYKIIYNDYMNNNGRIRWTIMHEIGHIVLNHLKKYEQSILGRGGLSEEEYSVLETEADFFASLILAPPIVLHNLNISTPKDIRRLCKLSLQASKNRYKYYLRWKNFIKVPEDDIIKNNFYNFINQKKCNNCDYGFISEQAKYCPVCGDNLEWGEGKMFYYNFIELDNDNRAIECPRCENEDINQGDDYCKICGAYLHQRCTGETDLDAKGKEYFVIEPCNVSLDSNARYCTECGRETTFYKNGFLKHWEIEKQEKEKEENEIFNTSFEIDDNFDVPF